MKDIYEFSFCFEFQGIEQVIILNFKKDKDGNLIIPDDQNILEVSLENSDKKLDVSVSPLLKVAFKDINKRNKCEKTK